MADRELVVEQLYDEHYRSLVGLARLLVDDRGAAEEVVQEGFVRLYASFRRLDDPGRALSYLRSIVLNQARGRLRRRRTVERWSGVAESEARLAGAADPTGDQADRLSADDERLVVEAIRRLPRRQRECVVLRYYGDCSDAEIADALSIRVGSVKTHLHRARQQLTNELEMLR